MGCFASYERPSRPSSGICWVSPSVRSFRPVTDSLLGNFSAKVFPDPVLGKSLITLSVPYIYLRVLFISICVTFDKIKSLNTGFILSSLWVFKIKLYSTHSITMTLKLALDTEWNKQNLQLHNFGSHIGMQIIYENVWKNKIEREFKLHIMATLQFAAYQDIHS